MVSQRRKKPQIGDIVKIPVTNGFAFAQYVNYHPRYGELLALLTDTICHEVSTYDMSELSNNEALYYFFLPLGRCLRRGEVQIAAAAEIPPHRLSFPMLRVRGEVDREGNVLSWFLWDGGEFIRVGELKPEYYDLSIAGIWGFELLVHRIDEGWRPRNNI